MRRLIFALAATAMFTSAPAMATTFLPGGANFMVSGNIFAGPMAATFGNSGVTEANTEYCRPRDVRLARLLNPSLLGFDAWVARTRVPVRTG